MHVKSDHSKTCNSDLVKKVGGNLRDKNLKHLPSGINMIKALFTQIIHFSWIQFKLISFIGYCQSKKMSFLQTCWNIIVSC